MPLRLLAFHRDDPLMNQEPTNFATKHQKPRTPSIFQSIEVAGVPHSSQPRITLLGTGPQVPVEGILLTQQARQTGQVLRGFREEAAHPAKGRCRSGSTVLAHNPCGRRFKRNNYVWKAPPLLRPHRTNTGEYNTKHWQQHNNGHWYGHWACQTAPPAALNSGD